MIAAAQAAASWARARRATWTDKPLPHPVAPATAPITAPYVDTLTEPEPIDEERVVSSIRHSAAPPAVPVPKPAVEEPGERAPWLTYAAVAAGVALVIGAGGYFAKRAFNAFTTSRARSATASTPAVDAKAQRKTVGSLKVTSTPDGARVVVDGHDRGITPLSLDDLSIGTHMVSIEARNGSVQRSVAVSPDYVAQLDEQIFDGWLAIFSPIEIVISEGNRVLRPDDKNEIMVPPGIHRLRFTNRTLAFDQSHEIVVKPGEKAAYTVTPPRSTLTVSASESAEVFLDGAKLGNTPLSAAPVAIGTHNLVVKRASGAEKRLPITVTVKPFTVNVDF